MDKQKIIEINNTDVWQRDNRILSNISLDVNIGEFIYIIGKVGTGKTSLINHLMPKCL